MAKMEIKDTYPTPSMYIHKHPSIDQKDEVIAKIKILEETLTHDQAKLLMEIIGCDTYQSDFMMGYTMGALEQGLRNVIYKLR